MKQTGYLIENLLDKSKFFTSTSSYDRPMWVAKEQATVYESVDSAERAIKKMIKYGVNSVRMINLAELAPPMSISKSEELPPQEELPAPSDAAPQEELPPEDEMVASAQEDVCPECGHEPCTCETHKQGDEIDVDADLPPEENEELTNRSSNFSRGHTVSYKGQEFVVVGDAGNGIVQVAHADDPNNVIRVHSAELLPVHESEKPVTELTDDELKRLIRIKTKNGLAHDLSKSAMDRLSAAKAEQARRRASVKESADVVSEPASSNDVDVSGDPETKVSVPVEAKNGLSAIIQKYTDEAEKFNGRDDARASFAMTVAAAASEIKELLDQGTVEALKQAQIRLSSFMNPITSLFPTETLKFISSGGRKPTLKDLFDSKRAK